MTSASCSILRVTRQGFLYTLSSFPNGNFFFRVFGHTLSSVDGFPVWLLFPYEWVLVVVAHRSSLQIYGVIEPYKIKVKISLVFFSPVILSSFFPCFPLFFSSSLTFSYSLFHQLSTWKCKDGGEKLSSSHNHHQVSSRILILIDIISTGIYADFSKTPVATLSSPHKLSEEKIVTVRMINGSTLITVENSTLFCLLKSRRRKCNLEIAGKNWRLSNQ